MLLALEIATESIGTQHLQGTEEHKETQAMHEMAHRWYLGIVFQRLIVLPYQLAAELEGILGRSLPKEGSQIIIERSLSATLEINKVRIAIFV